MIIREQAFSRAGLVGNPSDIFHGKTLSLLFDQFKAEVILYETPNLSIIPNDRDITLFKNLDDLIRYRRQFGYYGGIRIIEATIVRFKEHCDQNNLYLDKKNFTIEYHSDVPFGVGLGGSSTIIKAVFSALMRFYMLSEKEIPKPIQANLIWEAETKELNIHAGPQDRVVIVYGGLVYMDFTEEAYASNNGKYGNYYNLDPSLLPPLYIAYSDKLSKSSGEVHNIIRFRANIEHDDKILEVMKEKAKLVDEAKECLLKGEKDKLGPIMSRDFALRKLVYPIDDNNLRMIEIAKKMGTYAKFTGSGGAVIGTYWDDIHFKKLKKAYNEEGFSMIKVQPIEYSQNK